MNEIELGNVEETLFVPLRGRIFASNNYPHILYDKKALEITDKIPQEYLDTSRESEYTLLASAIRSRNIDDVIKDFLERNPEGTIINIGAGLETAYYRNDNQKAVWYELDLENVIEFRKNVLGNEDNDRMLAYSMFDYEWIRKVKSETSAPYLVISSGVFYYFKMNEVLDLLNNLNRLEDVEVVFDCVSKTGMKFTSKYMKQLGKEDASMYFYVDNPYDLIENVENASLIKSYDFYNNINDKSNMKFMTKISMNVSDIFHMVKMIHLKIEG